MANVTANKSGNPVMFKSIDEAPIRSLKAHFAPVQAGSGDPSPNNVRPITGRMGVEYGIGNTPLGIFPIDFQPQDIGGATLKYLGDSTFYIDGTVATSTAVSFPIDSFTLKSGAVYYVSMHSPNTFSFANDEGFIFAARQGSTNKFMARIAKEAFLNSLSFTMSVQWNGQETQIDHFIIGALAGESNIKIKISIYEESAIHNNSVNWESADTVYGGYVNLISGEVVRNTNYRVLNGTDDSTSSQYTQYGNYSPLGFGDTFGAGRRFTVSVDNAIDSIICDSLPIYTDTTSENFPYLYVMQQGNFIYYMVMMGKPSEHPEITNATIAIQYTSDWLKEHPVTVVWKTAPTTVTTLTPTQLSTFRGDNTIWSSANDIVEVEYDLHEAGDIATIRRRVNQGAPHLVTSTPADIATFNTDLAAPVKELRCEFIPVQDGSGDPSPENVRSIYGRSGMQIRSSSEKILHIANFEPIQCDGATLEYLGDNTFFINGTLNSNLVIPSISILDNMSWTANKKYIFMLSVISGRLTKNGYQFIEKNGNNSAFTFTSIDYYYAPNTFSTNVVTPDSDRIYEAIYMIVFAGASNVTFRINVYKADDDIYSYHYVDWESEAGTVYGGYVDLVKGELVATHQKLVCDGSVSFVTSDTSGAIRRYLQSVNTLGGNLPDVSESQFCPFNYLISSQSTNYPWCGYISTAGNLVIRVSSSDFTTSQDFSNYLAEHPLECVYKLATPIHTPITPTTLNTLKGANNVWSSANGPVTVKYWKH